MSTGDGYHNSSREMSDYSTVCIQQNLYMLYTLITLIKHSKEKESNIYHRIEHALWHLAITFFVSNKTNSYVDYVRQYVYYIYDIMYVVNSEAELFEQNCTFLNNIFDLYCTSKIAL